MQISLLFYYTLSFLSGIFSLCISRKHIIISLLRLELIILRLFCCYCFILSIIIIDYYILLIFLTFGVCEGVVGLSCLVIIIRSHGNDNLISITLMTC